MMSGGMSWTSLDFLLFQLDMAKQSYDTNPDFSSRVISHCMFDIKLYFPLFRFVPASQKLFPFSPLKLAIGSYC